MEKEYEHCMLCPRMCGADRLHGVLGACHAGAVPRVAHTMLHMWEEPCLSGKNGSGAVFFSCCPLGCVYCQNSKISRSYIGAEYDSSSLSTLFLSLEKQGAHNINLITATHFAPHIVSAIKEARAKGLHLPVIYNTSGYERQETLRRFDGLIDIYLTDVRYASQDTAKKYSHAPDYPHAAMEALDEMVRQAGSPQFDKDGLMTRGVIVRLLLLPGHLIEAKRILQTVYATYGEKVYISLMSQYTPTAECAQKAPELSRRVTVYEYMSFLRYAQHLGITQAYTQEGSAAEESFIPDFYVEKA